jgi:hypothetical protein
MVPAFEQRSVMPNPMPLDAPVTMATGCLLLFALIAFFSFGLV